MSSELNLEQLKAYSDMSEAEFEKVLQLKDEEMRINNQRTVNRSGASPRRTRRCRGRGEDGGGRRRWRATRAVEELAGAA